MNSKEKYKAIRRLWK